MIKTRFINTLFALLLLAITSLNGFSQKDTLFWFAAPNVSNGLGESPISIDVATYDNPSTITLSVPANGGFSPLSVTVPANTHHTFDLSSFLSDVEAATANTVGNTGIKITASTPITANYQLAAPNNKETIGLKGTGALGTDFYTPFQKDWSNTTSTPNGTSSIEIVASEDNTTVLITPKAAIIGHAQNATFSITLNKGQTYSAQDADESPTTSLAGSIISSDKPIAVTVFEDGLQESTCTDAIGTQLVNLDVIGDNYVVKKGTGTVDKIYILATQNGTNLTIHTSSTTTATISFGETYEVDLTDNIAYIEASKPVYVYHVSSMGCELSASLVPNVYCAGNYTTSTYRKNADDFGVVLYTRTGSEGAFTLNGVANVITASDFSPVPGSGGNLQVAERFFTTSEVPAGSFVKIANPNDVFGMAVVQGDASTGFSYSFLSNFTSSSFVNAGNDASVCANVNFHLHGVVGGGPNAGSWSSTGYGTFANGLNDLDNQYIPSDLDVLVNPVKIILTSTGMCPSRKDTLLLTVSQLPLVNASVDQTLCANNADTPLDGNVQGGSTTGLWSTIGGSGTFTPNDSTLSASYSPSTTDIANGNVKLVLTSTHNGNCLEEKDTMQIHFTPAPVVQIISDTLTVCANNDTVPLSGNVSGPTTTGVWTSTGDGAFSPNNIQLSTSYFPGTADISNGNMWIYLQSTSNGTCSSEKDSVYVRYTAEPSVNAGNNALICSNDTKISLNGTISGGATGGIWSGGNGTFTSSITDLNASYQPTAAEISSGQLVLTLTSTTNGNCLAVNDIVQYMFVAPPYANFNTQDNCLLDSSTFVNFSLPGYGTITQNKWIFDDGDSSSVASPSHTYAQPGNYSVNLIVTNTNGCRDTTQKTIQIFALPTADFTYTTTCTNNQRVVHFKDNSTSADSLNYFYYDFGGQGTINIPDYDFTFNNPGNYNVSHIISTVNGCSDTTKQIVEITPPPKAGFSYNFTSGVNVGTTFNFSDTSKYATSYHWDFGNGATSTEENPTTIYFENGVFPVIQFVYDDLGCFDSTRVWVSINNITKEINTLIPNAISPNGDGYNDVWKLPFIQLLYPKAIVEIYNKWGQQLFSSNGYDKPWDGTYHGENVPDGNYYYVINLNTGKGDQIYKGALLVLRKGK